MNRKILIAAVSSAAVLAAGAALYLILDARAPGTPALGSDAALWLSAEAPTRPQWSARVTPLAGDGLDSVADGAHHPGVRPAAARARCGQAGDADSSGITVYGSKATRFAYAVNNTLQGGVALAGSWKVADLAPGDYLLRIYAADYAGQVALQGRDLAITFE